MVVQRILVLFLMDFGIGLVLNGFLFFMKFLQESEGVLMRDKNEYIVFALVQRRSTQVLVFYLL